MARIVALSACACLAARARALHFSAGCDNLAVSSFEEFVRVHGRQYSGEEYERRKRLFEIRAAYVVGHNCADEHPWKAQVNHMVDWTDEELRALRGYKRHSSPGDGGSIPSLASLYAVAQPELPESVSYSHLQSIQTPTDQGQCGSCWAYAATTALDAHAELGNWSHGFSAAQVLACTPNPRGCGGNGGCSGATAELAFEYALNAGLGFESEFPMPEGEMSECPQDKRPRGDFATTGVATVGVHMGDGTQRHLVGLSGLTGGTDFGMLGWTKFPQNREVQLVQGLVTYGPVAVAVAMGDDWNWYAHGIMTPSGCDKGNVISHAVVLYGYGTTVNVRIGEVRYWQVKNSWGARWGEGGNMRLQRMPNEEGHCGWDESPEVGSGCKGGPKRVWVCGSCGILYDAVMPHFTL